jgi:hypothetical protein
MHVFLTIPEWGAEMCSKPTEKLPKAGFERFQETFSKKS